MKIALISNTDWYLYNFRLSFAEFLQKQGYEVVLISPPGIYAEKLQEKGFRWLPWNVGRKSMNLLNEWRSIDALRKIFRQERPAIVHHHTIKPVLYGSLAARLEHIPAVVNSITGLGYLFVSRDLRARVLRYPVQWLYRLMAKPARIAYVFENQFDRQFFVDHHMANRDNSTLIRSVGVDVNLFSPQPEPGGTPVALMAGRLLWDKGVGEFVEAARLLRPRLDIRMVLVGTPDPGNPSSIPEETIRGWVEEGIVEWWGWQDEMPFVYSRSNMVVVASYSEGVPTALIEGAACGRALIGTDIPGCREVIDPGKNGLVIPARDAVALAGAIEQLALHPVLRLQYGEAARRTAELEFADSLINQQTLKVYRTIAVDIIAP